MLPKEVQLLINEFSANPLLSDYDVYQEIKKLDPNFSLYALYYALTSWMQEKFMQQYMNGRAHEIFQHYLKDRDINIIYSGVDTTIYSDVLTRDEFDNMNLSNAIIQDIVELVHHDYRDPVNPVIILEGYGSLAYYHVPDYPNIAEEFNQDVVNHIRMLYPSFSLHDEFTKAQERAKYISKIEGCYEMLKRVYNVIDNVLFNRKDIYITLNADVPDIQLPAGWIIAQDNTLLYPNATLDMFYGIVSYIGSRNRNGIYRNTIYGKALRILF